MVQILMSTYNGEKYLKEQLKSIYNQTYSDVKILVRDDASKDNTVKILKNEKQKEKLDFYVGENIGPANSFLNLINRADECEYYAFSDQDDIWDKDKIEKAIKKIEKISDDIPVLYFSNTRLVDNNMNILKNVKKIKENNVTLGNALIENLATGCTIVFNKKLLEYMKLFEVEHIQPGFMHDSIIYRLASLIGVVIYDSTASISYRQHDNNVLGNSSSYLDKLKKRVKIVKNKKIKNLRSRMALELLNKYEKYICPDNLKKLKKVAHCNKSFSNKLNLLFDYTIRRNNIVDDFCYRIGIILGQI